MDLQEKKLEKRLERARESGKLGDWELCCRRLAEFRAGCGQYEGALRAYQEELAVCEAKEDAAGCATAHRMVGEMFSTLGQFAESLDHVNKYLVYSRSTKNAVEEQRALATIGRTYFCWASELKSTGSSKRDKAKAGEVLKECRKAYMKSLYICEQELKNVPARERQEMKARVLFNLGLACEIEEDLDLALSYVAKSIGICRQECLLEDLHRCYISKGTMLLKQSQTQAALASIDQACEVSKRISNSVELTVVALQQKAEVHFSMGNYLSAKATLKEAYRLKSPNTEDRQAVETTLKRAVILCDLEAKLTAIDEKALLERKGLYEKFGDACCTVKNYKHAIQCYLKMLDCARSLGQSEKELQPCYVSLYQTYMDDQQYDHALEYARKELATSSSVEAAKSHIVIADILDLKGAGYLEVSEALMAARSLSAECGDVLVQASALRRLMTAQRDDGREDLASETEMELKALGNPESEDSQSEEGDSPLDGVHLSDLSDVEEEQPRARPTRNTVKVTKNEKGETPLHVAAIRGDVARVERLIVLGHSVKDRDSAGWTPLHEAANYGYLDVARVLLEAGADVNATCDGVTPLHDAASCGHFDVMDLLLQHKASVAGVSDAGETALDSLRSWRKRVDLSDDDETLYEAMVNNLETKLSAAGFQRPKFKNDKPVIIKEKRSSVEVLKPKKYALNLRREVDRGDRGRGWGAVSPERRASTPSPPPHPDSPPDVTCLDAAPPVSSPSPSRESSPPRRPVADYRAAIDALRKRPHVSERARPRVEGPLIDESENYPEEWLDDDMRPNRTQKKKRKVIDLVERSGIRAQRTSDDFFFPLDDPENFQPVEDEQSRKKPKLQSTLLDAGFSASPVLDLSEAGPDLADSLDFPSLPSPPYSSVSDHAQAMTKVRINVGRFTLLVPIDSSRVEELTVRWLADQAAKRYTLLEGAEPQLLLKTRDGAMLAATDPVSVALGEDLDSTVTGWKTASLTDRYVDAVSLDASTPVSLYGAYVAGPDMAVMERLAACDSSRQLNLDYLALTADELGPVLRALKHEKGLRMLSLAGNALGDHGLATLLQCLELCTVDHINLRLAKAREGMLSLAGNALGDHGLATLLQCLELCTVDHINLRCNNITSSGLSKFADSLHTMSQDFLSSLRSLDLSFNPVGDAVSENKDKIASLLPNLTQFNTECCESDFLS